MKNTITIMLSVIAITIAAFNWSCSSTIAHDYSAEAAKPEIMEIILNRQLSKDSTYQLGEFELIRTTDNEYEGYFTEKEPEKWEHMPKIKISFTATRDIDNNQFLIHYTGMGCDGLNP